MSGRDLYPMHLPFFVHATTVFRRRWMHPSVENSCTRWLTQPPGTTSKTFSGPDTCGNPSIARPAERTCRIRPRILFWWSLWWLVDFRLLDVYLGNGCPKNRRIIHSGSSMSTTQVNTRRRTTHHGRSPPSFIKKQAMGERESEEAWESDWLERERESERESERDRFGPVFSRKLYPNLPSVRACVSPWILRVIKS